MLTDFGISLMLLFELNKVIFLRYLHLLIYFLLILMYELWNQQYFNKLLMYLNHQFQHSLNLELINYLREAPLQFFHTCLKVLILQVSF